MLARALAARIRRNSEAIEPHFKHAKWFKVWYRTRQAAMGATAM
jgi:hypothetical protein